VASDGALFGLVLVTVGLTVALIRWRPRAVREYFFNPIENGRTLLGALILIAGVITALNSGVAWMMLLALVGVAFATTYFYFEEPHKEIR